MELSPNVRKFSNQGNNFAYAQEDIIK